MGMGEAAQAVQVSAFPGRYIQQLEKARNIWEALQVMGGGGGAKGFIAGKGGRHRPVRGGSLTQGIHDASTGYPALDIGIPTGNRVYAVAGGRITRSEDLRGYEPRLSASAQNGYYSYGRVIEQSLNGGGKVLYAHLSQRFARRGQKVAGGSVIGLSGNTGHSYGSHLHFGATPMSPYTFMATGGQVTSDGRAFIHSGEAVVNKARTEALFASLDTFDRVMAQAQAMGGRVIDLNTAMANEGGKPGGKPTGNVRLGTYNVHNKTKNARTQADLERLMGAADVIGLTEFIGRKRNIGNWLEKQGWGVHRAKGPGADSALAYNRKKYEFLRGGSQKMNTMESNRGGGRTRYAAYGLLRDKDNGTEFWNVVAHAVNKKGGGNKYMQIQEQQFKALRELGNRLGEGGKPVFIMGDLNTLNPKIKGWSSRTGRGIDHIMAQAGVKMKGSRRVRGLSSDHPAVLAQYMFPGLAKGARNVNVEGLFRLHKNEAVLTDDINKQFKLGVERFANGPQNNYNVNMNFNGEVSDKAAMRRFIIDTFRGMEKAKPVSRRGTD